MYIQAHKGVEFKRTKDRPTGTIEIAFRQHIWHAQKE